MTSKMLALFVATTTTSPLASSGGVRKAGFLTLYSLMLGSEASPPATMRPVWALARHDFSMRG